MLELSAEFKRSIAEKIEGLAEMGQRVMAVGFKSVDEALINFYGDNVEGYDYLENQDFLHELENEIVFLGVIGMQDQPREEVTNVELGILLLFCKYYTN